jgi:hypothetical protein
LSRQSQVRLCRQFADQCISNLVPLPPSAVFPVADFASHVLQYCSGGEAHLIALRRWGLSRGERQTDVLEAVGAATASDQLEVTLDLTANMTLNEFLIGLEEIKQYVMSNNKWPAA